jgi:hypothetical protein
MNRLFFRYAPVLIALALASCQSTESPNQKSAGRAGFLQEAWISPAYKGTPVSSKFSSVYFAPVNTQYITKQGWWQTQTPLKQSSLAADTQKIATQLRDEFIKAASSHPSRKLKVAQAPGPDTLVIELALVELVPSKAFWNAAASAAGFAVPGAGFLSVAGRGSIAIEGRARDGGNNGVIAIFKDRRTDKVAPVNLGQYTWYHGAERNISDWASEFAEFINTAPDHVVQRSRRVSLKPW